MLLDKDNLTKRKKGQSIEYLLLEHEDELKNYVPSEPLVINISLKAYIKSMIAIAISSFTRPFTITYMDLTTGKYFHQ